MINLTSHVDRSLSYHDDYCHLCHQAMSIGRSLIGREVETAIQIPYLVELHGILYWILLIYID